MIAPQLSSPEACLYVDDSDPVLSLVHDLRQPLSSIESIAFYVNLHLTPDQTEARKYVLKLQDLVEEARQVLSRAAAVETKLAVAHA